ncbi:hypothetical protein [Nocardioides mesophilus]|uniref:Uncharacterized protein n=1 Tax=Nocardioides mesophilus TaxID=433659 RepID=A0A7G9RF82_9ACTN|nr:hypothetical protein [Nocardioides mesophilus]QNN54257.1 hypothetical protein H9L09_07925 [Nocardioides mesophilus]
MTKSLRCRLGWHRWRREPGDWRDASFTCLRCGRSEYAGDTLPPYVGA